MIQWSTISTFKEPYRNLVDFILIREALAWMLLRSTTIMNWRKFKVPHGVIPAPTSRENSSSHPPVMRWTNVLADVCLRMRVPKKKTKEESECKFEYS